MRKVDDEMNEFEENNYSIEISMDVEGIGEDEWGYNDAALLYAQEFYKKAGRVFDPECYTKEDVCFLCGIIAWAAPNLCTKYRVSGGGIVKVSYTAYTML
ncbi:hypothetical protein [Christensenella minuta]|uniref:hypothetical protein n=1 Tax=Christensenella minuta TaxID=626937 RepID=UPI002156F922|nr:hypothetical protein [Christensenella minuta]